MPQICYQINSKLFNGYGGMEHKTFAVPAGARGPDLGVHPLPVGQPSARRATSQNQRTPSGSASSLKS
ncbi:hypothetical protein SAMN04489710_11588 [Paracidovorax konjaci]|uniref:Uncharacterized protein n=1 Tax=Paracidovorax konjaci TaxID=32040 RepID=A0A1I1Y404_9BURK|nr:hypothetical protein SAMN04489710_11588 [Paracidovorax konjaci]